MKLLKLSTEGSGTLLEDFWKLWEAFGMLLKAPGSFGKLMGSFWKLWEASGMLLKASGSFWGASGGFCRLMEALEGF